MLLQGKTTRLAARRGHTCPLTILPCRPGQTIYDIEDKWEHPTMTVEDTWRFIPIAGELSSRVTALRCIGAGACHVRPVRFRAPA